MRFVDFKQLDDTIEALTALRTQIKSDTRIRMDNGLADLVTKSIALRYCIVDKCSDAVILEHAHRVANSVKEYQKLEKGQSIDPVIIRPINDQGRATIIDMPGEDDESN